MGMTIERAQLIIQVAHRNIVYFQEVNKQKKTEMSLDEHKEHLLDIMDSMPDDACGDWRDSLAYAIEIMNKYKKIQEIINNTDYIQEDVIRYQMICEVVKDGNDD